MTVPAPTEIEACLVALGPDPDALYESIKALDLVLDVRVGDFLSLELRDEYYDDEEGSLLGQQCALRLREVTDEQGQRTLLTFKGPAESHGDSCAERIELEQSWSVEFMGEVLEHMRSRDLPFPSECPQGDAQSVLAALGLRSIQVRENHRQLAVLGLPSQPIAELCLDRVTYKVADHQIDHYEIELEARGATSAQELLTLAADFEERYPRQLRAWPWAKTSTGRNLERMETRGELLQHLEGNRLSADGYTRLGVYLKLGAFLAQSPG